MLSKCFNSRCSETFRFFGQGRLFRIDRKARNQNSSTPKATAAKSCKTHENFWLCEKCARTMTIELRDTGEVDLVPLEFSELRPVPIMPVRKPRDAAAS